MNQQLKEIYDTWNQYIGDENISYKTIQTADDIISNLDYIPSYIWNTKGNIIIEYVYLNKHLFFIISEKEIFGKLCIDNVIKLEYVYLTCEEINCILDKFWE